MSHIRAILLFFFFFFNDTATTEIYTLSLHDALPISPIGADAVMLMTARVITEYAGQGLGRVLIQVAAKDVMRRGVRAVEAFGYLGDPDSPKAAWVIPTRFLTAVGFKTVREHRTYPRLRLDLRTALTW